MDLRTWTKENLKWGPGKGKRLKIRHRKVRLFGIETYSRKDSRHLGGSFSHSDSLGLPRTPTRTTDGYVVGDRYYNLLTSVDLLMFII